MKVLYTNLKTSIPQDVHSQEIEVLYTTFNLVIAQSLLFYNYPFKSRLINRENVFSF